MRKLFIESGKSNLFELKKVPAIGRYLFIYGGVDGARTRDFQRDRLAL